MYVLVVLLVEYTFYGQVTQHCPLLVGKKPLTLIRHELSGLNVSDA